MTPMLGAAFHLAIPVTDLAACERFYGEVLGCPQGRRDRHWIDFDFFGHQLVIHEVESSVTDAGSNAVDGHGVPVPHFGVVLSLPQWETLVAGLRAAGVEFVVEPHRRFQGTAGEQATCFLRDPAGNALEFKGFADPDGQLFATDSGAD